MVPGLKLRSDNKGDIDLKSENFCVLLRHAGAFTSDF